MHESTSKLAAAYGSLLILLLSALPPPAHGAPPPKAKWAPGIVETVVYAGETVSIPVSAEVTAPADSLSVWVVPELQPFVSFTPSEIADVQPGIQYQFELQIAVADAAQPQIVEGTVHLRTQKGTVARPLPIDLEVQWPSVTGPGGTVVTYPGTLYAETSVETGAIILFSKSDPTPPRSSDAVGFISVSFLANSHGQPMDSVFDGDPGDDLGPVYSTIDVDGRTGFEYRPLATLGGDRVVIVPVSTGFVQFNDIASSFSVDGPFEQVLDAAELPE